MAHNENPRTGGNRARAGTEFSDNSEFGTTPSHLAQDLASRWIERRFGLPAPFARTVAELAGFRAAP